MKTISGVLSILAWLFVGLGVSDLGAPVVGSISVGFIAFVVVAHLTYPRERKQVR